MYCSRVCPQLLDMKCSESCPLERSMMVRENPLITLMFSVLHTWMADEAKR